MKIYLVGGAVRDQLLGLPIKERDWVVVGASPEQMIALDFQPVGKEFPVFLHPETHEEYALARTERKVGQGYKGFTFYASPDVTLEQDLIRRDLTINAMAIDENGNIIDPFNGQKDLQKKIFRHVSDAFQEDPVRILRLARFATRFSDFSIHPSTLQLMKNIVKAGEIDSLTAERVWQEFYRALNNPTPERFFSVLDQCGARENLFPSIKLENAGFKKFNLAKKPEIRFAILTHDIAEKTLNEIFKKYRVPNSFKQLATLLIRHGKHYRTFKTDDAEAILMLLLKCDALRRKERFNDFLIAAECCFGNDRIKILEKSLKAIESIDTSTLEHKTLQGKEIAKAIYALRLEAISNKLGQ